MTTRACGEHAAFRFTWPGKPEANHCAEHALQVMAVANAIGLPLQMIPIGVGAGEPIRTEWPTCSQQVPEGTIACTSDSSSTSPATEEGGHSSGGAAKPHSAGGV